MKIEISKWLEKDGENFLRGVGIESGHLVLDFGSGEGHYTIPAAKVVGSKAKVYALDKDKGALDRLKKTVEQSNITNIDFIEENSKIPLKNDFLDAVLCYDVIHYEGKKKRSALYNEIRRVLKKGGLLSVYPKHHQEDSPLMELANVDLESLVDEIEKSGFKLEDKFSRTLLHDEYYNKGFILNFRRC